MDHPGADISVMKLDLADLSSVDSFADEIIKNNTDIDIFINNAGVFLQPGKTTKDGLELVLGTNYFGVYRLTERLIPYLLILPHEVTYIDTISLIHRAADIDYADFYCSEKYSDIRVYARSKLCLARYTYEKAKRCENSNVRIVMNHPGIALTPLGLDPYGKTVLRLSKVLGFLFNSVEKSSLSAAYIMAHDVPPGSIVGPDRLFGGWGYPKINSICGKVKTGAEELIRFTEAEIANHYGKKE